MARKRFLTVGGGERLLTAKLQILNGTGSRRPSLALGILTGRVAEPLAEAACPENYLQPVPTLRLLPPLPPVEAQAEPKVRQFTARTAYLADRHLDDLDSIIQAWQASGVSSGRVTRSAVIREAIEQLRTRVEAGGYPGPGEGTPARAALALAAPPSGSPGGPGIVIGPNAKLTPETK